MEREGDAGDPDDEVRWYILRRHPARINSKRQEMSIRETWTIKQFALSKDMATYHWLVLSMELDLEVSCMDSKAESGTCLEVDEGVRSWLRAARALPR